MNYLKKYCLFVLLKFVSVLLFGANTTVKGQSQNQNFGKLIPQAVSYILPTDSQLVRRDGNFQWATAALMVPVLQYTKGSILYTGTAGVVRQNNAKFFWDSTSTRLGVGTNTVLATFHVVGSSGSTIRIVDGNQGADKVLTSDADGDGIWTSVSTTTTFVPTVTLVGGAGNTVPVYSTNTGRYTIRGNTVFVDIWLTGDGGAEGAGTGQVNIALPFTSAASHPDGRSVAGVSINGTAEIDIYGTLAGSVSTISLFSRAVVSILGTNVQTADIGNFTGAGQNSTTRSIRLKFFYEK